ncbi:MAG: alpha/beta hydrolase [Actinomycetota bacterium]
MVPFLRGYHPDTIVAGRAYRREEFADDIAHLLDAVGEESAVLVGHDWGAAFVWATLGHHPERVRAAVPIAIPHPACLRPSPQLLWAVRHFFVFKAPRSDQRAARNDFAYVEGLYQRWSPSWRGPERDAAIERMKQAFGDPAVLHEALQYYRDLSLRPDPANDFRVPCPGLLVMGADDFGGDRGPYEASLDRFDAPAELLVVDGAGHWPHREGETEFTERLVALLDSLSPA